MAKDGINLFKTVRTENRKQSDTRYTYVFGALAMLTLAIGGFVAMLIWNDTTNDKLDKTKKNIASVEQEINSEKLTGLRTKIFELNKKSELITPIVESNVDMVAVVNLIRKDVPEGVRIENIKLSEDRVISLSGVSIDFRTIGKMMQKYSDSPDFSDFEVASINRVDKDSNLISGVRFVFDLKLKQKILRPDNSAST